jgi:RNA polymerase sigma-70 factor (ECF subfamily)
VQHEATMILPIPLDTLHRAQAGDADAFEHLLRMHERPVLRTAVRITGSLADGQDIAQEVFLKLHREMRQFCDIGEIGPWLYRVTVNACLDLGRKAKRRPVASMGAKAARWRSVESTPEHSLELAERKAMLEAGLQTLSERERAAIVLRELEGLSTAEVAGALGSTESTVRVQIAAARLKLRKFFEDARGSRK